MQIYEIPINSDRMETTQMGTFEFPLAVYENVISRNSLGFINWHWHHELQLCYVTRGIVTFFVNQKTVELREGQGMFINSHVLHKARDVHESGAIYVCIDFSPKLVGAFPNSVFDRKYVEPIIKGSGIDYVTLKPGVPWQEEILASVLKILDFNEAKGFGYEYDICMALMGAWKNLAANIDSDEGRKKEAVSEIKSTRLREIIVYIQRHYREKISLEDIAGHIHLSTNECCRFFKKNMKCTIFDYLTEYRIARSMELLEAGSMSVAQVAYEAGFGSCSYFIEKFKKKTGMTPNKYRRKDNKKADV